MSSRRSRKRLHERQSINVQSVLHGGRLQPKLRVGQPNDKYELEADRVAGQVMRMPEPARAIQFLANLRFSVDVTNVKMKSDDNRLRRMRSCYRQNIHQVMAAWCLVPMCRHKFQL